jgi:protocatechuate 3,4-dioxygenase beta subunit
MTRRRWLGVLVLAGLFGLGGFAWWHGHGAGPAVGTGTGGSRAGAGDGQLAALEAAHAGTKEADPTPAIVRGQVTDKASGAPLAGAMVAVSNTSAEAGMRTMAEAGAVAPHAVSDASGHFEISGVYPGEIVVGAAAVGHLPGSATSTVAPHGEARVAIALERGGQTLSGTVTDVGGGPIGGAIVSAGILGQGLGTHARAMTISDQAGHYAVQLGDGRFDVRAVAEGYVPGAEVLDLEGAPLTHDFILTPGATLAGVVLSRKDHAPVADAQVVVKGGHASSDGGGFNFSGGPGGQMARTDASGHFRLSNVRSGRLSLSATAPALATTEPVEVDVGVAESVDDVEILLDHALTIRGFVVRENAPKEGVPGVAVIGWSMKGAMVGPAISDAAGAFALTAGRPGTYLLFAFKEGEAVSALRSSATVDKDDVDGVIVTLPAGTTLTGRVEPPQVAELSFQVPRKDMGLMTMGLIVAASTTSGQSKADGSFEIPRVPLGTLELVATGKDGSSGTLTVTVTETRQDGLVVKLEPRAQIQGTVIDASGKPVAGVQVSFSHKAPAAGSVAVEVKGDDGSHGSAKTDAAGHFVVRGLSDGEYEVAVSDDLGELQPESGEDFPSVTLARAEQKKGVELRVASLEGTISGRVVDGKGAGMGDAWVVAKLTPAADERVLTGNGMSFARATAPTLTDPGGNFTISRVRTGKTYTVSGEKGALRGEVTLVKADKDIVIHLLQLASLSGKVTDPSGRPVTHYDLAVVGAGGGSHTIDDPAGHYELSRLYVGAVTVTVRAGNAASSGKVLLEAGKAASLDLVLAPLGEVRGKVVDARTRQPIAGIIVLADGEAGAGGDSDDLTALLTGGGPKTDSDGRFTLGKLSAGSYRIIGFDMKSAMLGGSQHVGTQSELELGAGEHKDLGVICGLGPDLVPAAEQGELGVTLEAGKVKPYALMVKKVVAGGPAAAAGLAVGDQVMGIDDLAPPSCSTTVLEDLVAPVRVRIGQVLALHVMRAGKPLELSITARAPTP